MPVVLNCHTILKKTSVDHALCEILGVERHGGVNIVY